MYNYNTILPPPLSKTYGKNLQKLVEYICNIPDQQERKAYATSLLPVMDTIQANKKHKKKDLDKLWDDIILLSNYQLDVETPNPKPTKPTKEDVLSLRILYNQEKPFSKHYGHNLYKLVQQIAQIEDHQQRQELYKSTINMIWHIQRKNTSLETILIHLEQMTGEKIEVNLEDLKKKNTKPYNKQNRNIPNRRTRRPLSSIKTANAKNNTLSQKT